MIASMDTHITRERQESGYSLYLDAIYIVKYNKHFTVYAFRFVTSFLIGRNALSQTEVYTHNTYISRTQNDIFTINSHTCVLPSRIASENKHNSNTVYNFKLLVIKTSLVMFCYQLYIMVCKNEREVYNTYSDRSMMLCICAYRSFNVAIT